MQIVYNGRFAAVEVPDVGNVVLTRGEPKEVADTPKSRQLLQQPDFSEAKTSGTPHVRAKPPKRSDEIEPAAAVDLDEQKEDE